MSIGDAFAVRAEGPLSYNEMTSGIEMILPATGPDIQ